MINALKAEYRKIFTVRSTYVMLLLTLAALLLLAFFANGIKIDNGDLHNPLTLTNDITAAIGALAIFPALIALLLFTHEYRHNTILYTLTESNSRSRVLLAKIIVLSVFSLIYTLIVCALSPLLANLGIHAHSLHLVHQSIHYGNLLWRVIMFGWGYTMVGLLVAVLIRNQIGAIVTLFILPETVEGLLGLLLKKNAVYLPFNSLHVLVSQGLSSSLANVSDLTAMLVFLTYLVIGWVVAWVLFLKRDAL